MSRSRKRRGLTKADQALFERAMSDVTPIKARDQVALDVPSVSPPGKDDLPLPFSWQAGTGASPLVRLQHPALETRNLAVRADAPAPNSRLERRAHRSLARGHQSIDRSIDLHGLNQENAFAVLVRTIERAVARDMKTVLVITGKGGTRFSQLDAAPAAQRTRADFSPMDGVLKRMVPIWLAGDALRPFVESYGIASPVHGGEGALYVRLRRRKKRG